MSWVQSCDVYEALNALERGGERHIDGKLFRLVAGRTPEDKLFQVVNRHGGMKDHFSLLDAVHFALTGELVPDPGFRDLREPYLCEQCDALQKVHTWRDRRRCSACGLSLCASCQTEHQEPHEPRLPSERALAVGAVVFEAACDAVRDLLPAAWMLTRGSRP